MKKSTATEAGAGTGTGAGSGSGSSPTTSLDTVINTKDVASSETDASASPLWTLRKLRNHQSQAAGGGAGGGGSGPSSSHHSTENTSMVFNFSKSTKEVPDYIESDVVIYRRKRELPKVSGVGILGTGYHVLGPPILHPFSVFILFFYKIFPGRESHSAVLSAHSLADYSCLTITP